MTDDPIDTAVLRDLEETTGSDFLDELVTTFLADAPGLLADLGHAAGSRDEDGFRRAAHSIKSNASTFGAHALAAVARHLELAGLAAVQDADTGWQRSIEAEYARAAAVLQAYVDG
jgi:HPt (histidine-containing phosphotransfer) domain-containing protein